MSKTPYVKLTFTPDLVRLYVSYFKKYARIEVGDQIIGTLTSGRASFKRHGTLYRGDQQWLENYHGIDLETVFTNNRLLLVPYRGHSVPLVVPNDVWANIEHDPALDPVFDALFGRENDYLFGIQWGGSVLPVHQ